MYLVTGGAGFVGSHLVRALNARGVTDVLVVDSLGDPRKLANLKDCQVSDLIDKQRFFEALRAGRFEALTGGGVRAIYHQGACTNTLEMDSDYLEQNNTLFSRLLLEEALSAALPFVYASSAAVYGAGSDFVPAPKNEGAINPYGESKLRFDQQVRELLPRARSTVAGLRYFNVYGPRETHKGPMASMIYQLYRQLQERGVARLFGETPGYAAGEQARDFVFVEDVVDVNLFLGEGPPRQGIFNVGSGRSRTFNQVAEDLIKGLGAGRVEYFPFPQRLEGKYQSFTQADLSGLRATGYAADFTSLEDGIARSLTAWRDLAQEATPC